LGGLPRWLKPLVFALALVPLARLFVLGFGDGLGANPVEFVTRSTGTWALVMLCITLSVTPLRKLAGWTALVRLRRMLGLFAFFYATLHFVIFIWLEHWFDLGALFADVLDRPFVTVGFLALLLMLPLTLTSTQAMMRRLGRRWQALHRLVYLIAPLAVLHFWWHKAGKNDFTEPGVYAAIVAALLLFRLVARFYSGSRLSSANRSSVRSRSRTSSARSPSTSTSAPRGRVL
jgi:sulfoxide reductase heme-binding subunit YedZ